MRVIGVQEFGGPEALAVHEVPEPHAGPGEVRIGVRAFAVNPTDAGVRGGGRDLGGAQPPYVPGMDAAGIVDEVGEGVDQWQTGDEVMAIAPLREHGERTSSTSSPRRTRSPGSRRVSASSKPARSR